MYLIGKRTFQHILYLQILIIGICKTEATPVKNEIIGSSEIIASSDITPVTSCRVNYLKATIKGAIGFHAHFSISYLNSTHKANQMEISKFGTQTFGRKEIGCWTFDIAKETNVDFKLWKGIKVIPSFVKKYTVVLRPGSRKDYQISQNIYIDYDMDCGVDVGTYSGILCPKI